MKKSKRNYDVNGEMKLTETACESRDSLRLGTRGSLLWTE